MRLALILLAVACAWGQANPVVRTAGTLTSNAVVIGGGSQVVSASSLTATVTKMTAGVPSAATVGTDYGTPDATAKTYTNTTYDAAGSGNVFTSLERKYLTAAGCANATATAAFDTPTANAATATCIGTTTTTAFLVYADGSTQVSTLHTRSRPTGCPLAFRWFSSTPARCHLRRQWTGGSRQPA